MLISADSHSSAQSVLRSRTSASLRTMPVIGDRSRSHFIFRIQLLCIIYVHVVLIVFMREIIYHTAFLCMSFPVVVPPRYHMLLSAPVRNVTLLRFVLSSISALQSQYFYYLCVCRTIACYTPGPTATSHAVDHVISERNNNSSPQKITHSSLGLQSLPVTHP